MGPRTKMASHPALLSWPSLSTFRRSHRAYYYTILAILLLFILRSISTHRQEDHWLYPSFNSSPDVEHSRLPVIRPGDITASSPREVRPQDDTAPVAREPIRLGTLRDVRYVGTWFHNSSLVFELIFLTSFLQRREFLSRWNLDINTWR